MQVLIDRCSGGQYVAPEHIDQAISKLIPIGALVRVVDGPFEGMRAPVHWSHHQRVSVLLSFLGVPRKIDLPARSVEVVGRA
jgi:transcription antitermination factor NusG